MKQLYLICWICFLNVAITQAQVSLVFDFSNDAQGWIGDFADYPKGQEDYFKLEFTRTNLPRPLNTNKQALKLSGFNHSDDLFMFIKRKITGLIPNTRYQISFRVEFASDAPTNAFGTGGPPGEGVVLKAGATKLEPQKEVDKDGYYRMNIDKDNQSQPGKDMDTIGHIGVSDTTSVFTLIARNNYTHPFIATSNEKGELWVIIGTESGFESSTTLFYNEIKIDFKSLATSVLTPERVGFQLYPNPSAGEVYLKSALPFNRMDLFSTEGRWLKQFSGRPNQHSSIAQLQAGVYVLKIQYPEGTLYQKLIIQK
jgi:hypothetical protein